ncbi:hypothetical protein M2A18_04145, partial [Mesomycoplasma ovipneumoniae]
MTKTTKNLSKIFFILTPFSPLVFLQSASYELPIYNLEVKKDTNWRNLVPGEEYSLPPVTNDNFNFNLGQSEKNWKITVGLNSPYGGFTGQNDVVKQFSPIWFSKQIMHTDRLCSSTGYNCGVVHFSTTTIPDGVYSLKNKPDKSIPDDNFQIDLEDILYGKTTLRSDQKFTDFFNSFNISLRAGNNYHQYTFHQGISGLGRKFIVDNSFNKDNMGQFNLTNIKLNFEYTVKNNIITKLAVTIRAFVEYKTKTEEENQESSKLRDYFNTLKNSFNSNSNFPGKYEIPTDSGASRGILAPRPVQQSSDTNVTTLKSNREYWDEKLKKWFDNATSSNLKYNTKYDWSYW